MMFVFTEDGVLRRPFRLLAGLAGYLLVAIVGAAAAASRDSALPA